MFNVIRNLYNSQQNSIPFPTPFTGKKQRPLVIVCLGLIEQVANILARALALGLLEQANSTQYERASYHVLPPAYLRPGQSFDTRMLQRDCLFKLVLILHILCIYFLPQCVSINSFIPPERSKLKVLLWKPNASPSESPTAQGPGSKE